MDIHIPTNLFTDGFMKYLSNLDQNRLYFAIEVLLKAKLEAFKYECKDNNGHELIDEFAEDTVSTIMDILHFFRDEILKNNNMVIEKDLIINEYKIGDMVVEAFKSILESFKS